MFRGLAMISYIIFHFMHLPLMITGALLQHADTARIHDHRGHRPTQEGDNDARENPDEPSVQQIHD